MSTCPGRNLEDYLMWAWDLRVEGLDDANPSLQIAEVLGVPTRRVTVSAEQFSTLVFVYEPYRENIEHLLASYDEDMSWRDYAGCVDWAHESVDQAASELVADWRRLATKGEPVN